MRVVAVETLRCAVQPNVLILRLHTDQELVGLGESFYGARAVEAYLHESVAPALFAAGDVNPESAVRLLAPYVGYQGSGVETRGNAAVDMALWDLLGKVTGKPVNVLLGGPVRTSVPVYNTCAGYSYVSKESRVTTANWGLPAGEGGGLYEDLEAFLHRPAELARSLYDEGYRAMKVWPFDQAAEQSLGSSISVAQIGRAVDVLDAIRGELGTDMDILVELHGLWNLPSAKRIVRALEPYAPFWVEDPLSSTSVDGYAELADASSCPIATGETLTGRRAFKHLLDRGAIDVAIVDIGWTGGLTEARKIAAMADTFDVPMAPHDCTGPIQFAACVHLVSSQPNGLIQETVRAFRTGWYSEFVTGLPVVEEGHVQASGAPGLGIELADDFLQRSDVARTVSRAS